MIKRVISLVIFLLLANAAYRVGIVYFHDQQFKDAVGEVALFAGTKPEDALKAKVMDLAAENQIPLDPDFIEIGRKSLVTPGDRVTIKYSYAVMIAVVPGYPRRFEFSYTTQ
jgi:hypothetical protein